MHRRLSLWLLPCLCLTACAASTAQELPCQEFAEPRGLICKADLASGDWLHRLDVGYLGTPTALERHESRGAEDSILWQPTEDYLMIRPEAAPPEADDIRAAFRIERHVTADPDAYCAETLCGGMVCPDPCTAPWHERELVLIDWSLDLANHDLTEFLDGYEYVDPLMLLEGEVAGLEATAPGLPEFLRPRTERAAHDRAVTRLERAAAYFVTQPPELCPAGEECGRILVARHHFWRRAGS